MNEARPSTWISLDVNDTMVPTKAAAQTARAAPVMVALKRSEIRPLTSADATITRPTPPTSRIVRFPAATATSEAGPRPARRAVIQSARFRRAIGSGRFLIAEEICIRELRRAVPNRVVRTISAPIAIERATEPKVIGYRVGP